MKRRSFLATVASIPFLSPLVAEAASQIAEALPILEQTPEQPAVAITKGHYFVMAFRDGLVQRRSVFRNIAWKDSHAALLENGYYDPVTCLHWVRIYALRRPPMRMGYPEFTSSGGLVPLYNSEFSALCEAGEVVEVRKCRSVEFQFGAARPIPPAMHTTRYPILSILSYLDAGSSRVEALA